MIGNVTFDNINLTNSFVWNGTGAKACDKVTGAYYFQPRIVYNRVDENTIEYRLFIGVYGKVHIGSVTQGNATTTGWLSYKDLNSYTVYVSVAGTQRTISIPINLNAANRTSVAVVNIGGTSYYKVRDTDDSDWINVKTSARSVRVSFTVMYTGTDSALHYCNQYSSEIETPVFAQVSAVPTSDQLELGSPVNIRMYRNLSELETIGVEGAVASFDDAAIAPLKSLTVTINPVQSGSGDPSPSNIRPITGHSGVTIYDDPDYGGLVNWNQKAPALNTTNWKKVASNSSVSFTAADGVATVAITGSTSSNTHIYPSTTPTVTDHVIYARMDAKCSNAQSDQRARILYFQNASISRMVVDRAVAEDWTTYETIDTITITPAQIRFYVTTGSNSDFSYYIRNPQIIDLTQMFGAGNEPTTVEALRALLPENYYAYNAGEETTIGAINGTPGWSEAITFPSTPGTVYGGSLDVTTGVLTVDKSFVDLGELSWTRGSTTASDGVTTIYYFQASGTPFAPGFDNSGILPDTISPGKFMCDRYVCYRSKMYIREVLVNDGLAYTNDSGVLRIRDDQYSTADAFKTALSGSICVYDLATPVTYQLSPAELITLSGQNNIWTDANGDVSLEYRTGDFMEAAPIKYDLYYMVEDEIAEVTIAEDIDATGWVTTYSWTPPTSLANHNTTSKYVKINVACITYYDGDSIGTAYTGKLDYKIPEYMPTCSATTTPYSDNTTVNSWGIYLQGYSSISISVTASSQYGATIVNYSTEVDGVLVWSSSQSSGVTSVINKSGTVRVSVYVTDSRGYTSLGSIRQLTFYPYSAPQLSDISCFRCDSSGNADDLGAYLCVQATKTYWMTYHNTCSIRVSYGTPGNTPGNTVTLTDGTPESLPPGSSYAIIPSVPSLIGSGNILPSGTYIVSFVIADALNSSEVVLTVERSSSGVTMNVKDGGRAIAFGDYATVDDSFHIANGLKLLVNDSVYGDELPSSGNAGRVFFHVEEGGASNGYYRCTPYVYTDGTYDETDDDTHPTIFDLIYPVGSIYMSVNSTDPGLLFGGTWQRIQDTFLLAAGTTYAAGASGGEATHTLIVDEMPSHRHSTYVRAGATESGTSRRNPVGSGDSSPTTIADGTSYVGGGQAHNNMPPYLAVYVWQRTAMKRPAAT